MVDGGKDGRNGKGLQGIVSTIGLCLQKQLGNLAFCPVIEIAIHQRKKVDGFIVKSSNGLWGLIRLVHTRVKSQFL